MAHSVHFKWQNLRMGMAVEAIVMHLGVAAEADAEAKAEVVARWTETATENLRGSERTRRWLKMLQGNAYSNSRLRLIAKQSTALKDLIDHPIWQALGYTRITRERIRGTLPATEVPAFKAYQLTGLPCTTSAARVAWLLLWLRVTPPLYPLLQSMLAEALRCELPRLLFGPPWQSWGHQLSELLRERLQGLLGGRRLRWYDTEQALTGMTQYWSVLRTWGMGTPLFHDEAEWCQFCEVCDRLRKEQLSAVFNQLAVFDRQQETIFDSYTLRCLYQKVRRQRQSAANP
ncbi:hypothetical protein ABH912_005396 [Pseudomonas sp. BT76 TE3572]|uniref:Uncharacterized protein n=1 Tax=Pseudomonas mandelii PD30 TaxID=1419583 RepID=A0A059KVT9_9PSED|nr:hypothetical protein [Pseudomonas mandelii]KDD66178.1 hypothetical protein V466_25690 [Pseudomonas mandelii PD30]